MNVAKNLHPLTFWPKLHHLDLQKFWASLLFNYYRSVDGKFDSASQRYLGHFLQGQLSRAKREVGNEDEASDSDFIREFLKHQSTSHVVIVGEISRGECKWNGIFIQTFYFKKNENFHM